MAEKSALEVLGLAIMSASVKAQFLELPYVVQLLDSAFSEVVRFAMVAQAEKREKKRVEGEEKARED